MAEIARQRCFNHSRREAAARCLSCERYFCRECVTEHEGRMICASCLDELVKQRAEKKPRFAGLAKIFQAVLAVLLLWLFFFLVGQGLLSIPSEFHLGSVFRTEE